MGDTKAATEARKAKAMARREADDAASKTTEAELTILKRFGEFMPENAADPVAVYRLWKKSIFGEFFEDADDSIMYFIVAQAKMAGIDVRIPKQIYAIPFNKKFKDSDGQWQTKKEWTVITGIEGLTTIAERTGQFGGVTKPEYEFGVSTDEGNFGQEDQNKIISCTVGVHKIVQGVATTSYATAYFDEYDTGKNLWRPANATKQKAIYKNGKATGQYETVPDGGKPKTMIAKVARAQALRAAFSACAGMYVAEEVERGDVIDGELVTPDLEQSIKEVKSPTEMKQLMDTLTVEDKKRAAPLMAERLKELK
jgi:hypothetical protein